jgi:dephospho-CoA kinase
VAKLSVGLTGGLASGKSTVASHLAAAGFTVVDADALVAELYRPGEPGARSVAALLGSRYLTADGGVDKAAVARRVFADSAARERLEAALFPLVRERFRALAARTDGIAVLEASKLVEAGLQDEFDLVVTVEAPLAIRLARAIARGLDPAEARARITAQASEAQRRAAADFVIENDGRREELACRTDELIDLLRSRRGR